MPSNLELLKPVTIGSIGTLKNRVAMSAMTRARANNENNVANDIMTKYYLQRNSVGLIISEGTHVSKRAVGWIEAPGIYTDEQAAGWKKVTDAIHGDNGLIVAQLWHQGRQAHESHNDDVVAPSAIAPSGEAHTREGKVPFNPPRALETEEVPEIAEEFRQGAAKAVQAGFDGVEIHGANGYIVDQFLQSKTNKRTDKYGGSVENRNLFLKEVIEAVLKEWPADKVGIKLSPNGAYGDMGSEDYVEQFDLAVKTVAEYKLAYISLVDGLTFGFHELGEPFTAERAMNIINKVQPEKRLTSIIGNCGYTKETAEEAVKSGNLDAISFGRLLITNPDLVSRFENDYPLNETMDPSTWMTFGMGEKGYTTYEEYRKE